ncbi:MAG: hypothetical protein MZV63_58555 [Marinilabiliales bacterium]|nr:hypothetical protein [Marinilabiliales bacterium]
MDEPDRDGNLVLDGLAVVLASRRSGRSGGAPDGRAEDDGRGKQTCRGSWYQPRFPFPVRLAFHDPSGSIDGDRHGRAGHGLGPRDPVLGVDVEVVSARARGRSRGRSRVRVSVARVGRPPDEGRAGRDRRARGRVDEPGRQDDLGLGRARHGVGYQDLEPRCQPRRPARPPARGRSGRNRRRPARRGALGPSASRLRGTSRRRRPEGGAASPAADPPAGGASRTEARTEPDRAPPGLHVPDDEPAGVVAGLEGDAGEERQRPGRGADRGIDLDPADVADVVLGVEDEGDELDLRARSTCP